MDHLRRAFGKWFDLSGLGPIETPSRTVFSRNLFTLRAYGSKVTKNPVVLIVPAPIKRPYIWDMLPKISPVQRFLESQMQVYAIYWERPGPDDQGAGLDRYAGQSIAECISAIEAETGKKMIVLAGHSLGGTLATIFASLYPERVKGLVLITAPLHFGQGRGDLDDLVAYLPPARFMTLDQGNVPGSMLDAVALISSPVIFGTGRWLDRIQSLGDCEALRTHICAERWSLDEAPIARQLFEDTMECLYRHDQFFQNKFYYGGKLASLADIRAPVIGVLDEACTIVPPQSFLPALDVMRSHETKVLWYEGDRGVSIRHLGTLIGKSAHEKIWPEIVNWVQEIWD